MCRGVMCKKRFLAKALFASAGDVFLCLLVSVPSFSSCRSVAPSPSRLASCPGAGWGVVVGREGTPGAVASDWSVLASCLRVAQGALICRYD